MKTVTLRSMYFLLLLFIFDKNIYCSDASLLFNSCNRYALSEKFIETTSEYVNDSQIVFFHSLPLSLQLPVSANSIQLEAKNQLLKLSIGTTAGVEANDNASNRFGVIQGKCAYNSPFLNAYIDAFLFSTEDRLHEETKDIEYERFLKGKKEETITGMFDFKFNLPYAYLELYYKSIKLSIGKEKLRWGPGYKGTLALSGTAFSPTYLYNFELQFGSSIHLQAFLNAYDDESLFADELKTTATTKVKNSNASIELNIPRYGAGQRLDLVLTKYFQLGIYEMVDFFGSSDLARFANPLQIYYFGNSSSNTNNANLLAGLDFNLRFNQFRVYGEFLNDDITIFENVGNPNKYAWQTGIVYYGNKRLLQAGIEYTHIAKYVYSHYTALNRHSHWGEPMGWPWGNDQDLFNAHINLRINEKLSSVFEVNYWIMGTGKITDDWNADKRPDLDNAPYWPQNAQRSVSLIAGMQYHPKCWINVSAYYEPRIMKNAYVNSFNMYMELQLPVNKKHQLR